MAVPTVKSVKGPTAYFVFSEQHREECRQALLAGKEPGTKVSVAEVAKELGRRWKSLSDAEKEEYKVKARAVAEAREAAAQQHNSQQQSDDQNAEQQPEGAMQQSSNPAAPKGLPISLVKRIISIDDEVGRISHDGMLVITQATEMFLEMLAAKCAKVVASSKPKRSTVKLQDFGEMLKRDRRLVTAGLRDVVAAAQQAADTAAAAKESVLAETNVTATQQQDMDAEGNSNNNDHEDEAAAGKENEPNAQETAPAKQKQAKGQKRKAVEPPSNNSRPITAFFSRSVAPQTA